MTDILHTSYSVWKQVVQNNGFQVYFWEDGYQKGSLWAGNRDTVYETRVVADTWGDFETNFYDDTIAVGRRDDAIAQVVGLTNIKARPVTADNTPITAERNLRLGQAKFIHRDGYEEMARNAAPAGTLYVAWNGNGPQDPGGDWPSTGVGSQTGASARTGSYGWDTGQTATDDRTILTAYEDLDLEDAYGNLSFWMQPIAFPRGSRLRVSWWDSSDALVGNPVNIANYVPNFDTKIWQKVTIPISDFNLRGGTARKLIFTFANEERQRFYIDDIELDITDNGSPHVFYIEADAYQAWHIGCVNLVISAGTSNWSSGAFATISDGLTNGVLIRQYDNDGYEDATSWSINIKDNIDLFGRLQLTENVDFFDGERLISLELKPQPASVVLSGNVVLQIIIRDDLSTLHNFRAYAQFGIEDIPNG